MRRRGGRERGETEEEKRERKRETKEMSVNCANTIITVSMTITLHPNACNLKVSDDRCKLP